MVDQREKELEKQRNLFDLSRRINRVLTDIDKTYDALYDIAYEKIKDDIPTSYLIPTMSSMGYLRNGLKDIWTSLNLMRYSTRTIKHFMYVVERCRKIRILFRKTEVDDKRLARIRAKSMSGWYKEVISIYTDFLKIVREN